MKLIPSAFVVSVFTLWTSLAAAWVPTGFRWRLPVTYEINTASSQELGRDTTLQVIQDSYTNWAAPACSGYTSTFQGETNQSWNSGDGMNTLVWFYNPNQRPRELGGRATIGVTLSVFRGNDAFDGDILFNGIDHSWTTNAVRNGQVDAVSIITHETGHQLGLNHSPFQNATMYAAYLGGNGAATLAEDDIAGVCNLYPSGAAPECQQDDDCDGDERCVAGSCVAGEAQGTGAIGDPCGQSAPCDNGLFCVSGGSGPFCTRSCNGDCPQGWACSPVQINGRRTQICLPDPNAGAVGDAEFGEDCQTNNDCRQGFCIGDGQRSFCSQSCRDAGDCPDNAQCAALQGGGGACVPVDPGSAMGEFGDACAQSTDCVSNVCLQTQSGAFCSALCMSDNDCPASGECVAVQGGGGACVPRTAPMQPDSGVPSGNVQDMAFNPTPRDFGPGLPTQDAGVGTGQGQGTGEEMMPGGGFVVVKQPSQSGCAVAAEHNKSPIKVLGILVVLLALRRRTSTVVIDD